MTNPTKLSTGIDTTQASCYSKPRMATRLNLRRGFNRIYLILAILWCFWVLWLPVKARNEEYSRHFRDAYDDWTGCRDNHLKSIQQCDVERDTALAEAKHNTLDKNPYLWASGGFNAWLVLLPVFMVVPPAIVYGFLFALVKLALWLIKGFRS